MDIKIVEVPGVQKELTLNEGQTVQDAITLSGMNVSGKTVMVNSTTVTNDLSYVLEDGDLIKITKPIQGN